MELIIIIAVVVIGGYLAFRHYTKNVTVDEELVAPYKKEAPILGEAAPTVTTVQSFPTSRPGEVNVTAPAAMTAKPKPLAKPKPVKAPAKPNAPTKAKPVVKPKTPVKTKAVKATAARPKK